MELSDFAATDGPTPGRRRKAEPSTPWAPGLEHDGTTGTLTTGALDEATPDWDHIFRHWNLDPDVWDVEPGSLRVNAWEGPSADGARIFRQYKASIRRRTGPTLEVDDLVRKVTTWKPRKPKAPTGPASFVVCCADWQVGGHGGTPAFLERFHTTLDQLVPAAKAAARECSELVVLFLGDMLEGPPGANYDAQGFEIDLGRREQLRVVRQCEAQVLKALAPYFATTQAVAVAGNHGRGKRKVDTHPEDNDDLLAFESVAELLTESGAADTYNLRFIAPRDAAVAIVETSGTTLLVGHGDTTGGSADKLRDHWRKLAFTRTGDADLGDVFVTGHRHHLRVEELAEDRWLMVCPTLGGPSRWFADIGGGTSRPGTLTFRTAGRKWWNLDNVQPDTP